MDILSIITSQGHNHTEPQNKVGHIDILGANSWKYVLDYALTSFACKKSASSSTLPNTACAMRDFSCLDL